MRSRKTSIQYRPDHFLVIIRKPSSWLPKNYFEVPPRGEIVSRQVVASYSEAHDDLVRCNRIAMAHSLDVWAVIETAE